MASPRDEEMLFANALHAGKPLPSASIGAVRDGGVRPDTRAGLLAHLQGLGVREDTYSLFGAHLDDALVMDQRFEGWVVFYSERGGESALAVHRSEAAACADLLSRLTSDDHVFFDLVAGPAPPAEADASFEDWLRRRGVTRDDLDADDWKLDDVPWLQGPYWRRYFVRITAIRQPAATP